MLTPMIRVARDRYSKTPVPTVMPLIHAFCPSPCPPENTSFDRQKDMFFQPHSHLGLDLNCAPDIS